MRSLLSLCISLLAVSFLYGQAPDGMSYQTVIRDQADDLLANSSVAFRISILQGSETGNAVYTETHSATTNDNGLATMTIGAGNSSDNFNAINWSSGNYYLQTEVDLDGGTNYTLSGSSQLLSVPYAFFAEKSGDSGTGGGPVGGKNLGVLSASRAYAFDADQNMWNPVSLTGEGVDIVESNNNIGVMSTSRAYAFSDAAAAWQQVNMVGEPMKIVESNGSIGVLTASNAYAWSSDAQAWAPIGLTGGGVDIVASGGNIGVISGSFAYAYNSATGAWKTVDVTGEPLEVSGSNGNIGVISASRGYAFNADADAWAQVSVTGGAFKVVGSN